MKYVKISNDGKYTIEERFINFIKSKNKTGLRLVVEMLSKIKNNGLYINNFRAQSFTKVYLKKNFTPKKTWCLRKLLRWPQKKHPQIVLDVRNEVLGQACSEPCLSFGCVGIVANYVKDKLRLELDGCRGLSEYNLALSKIGIP